MSIKKEKKKGFRQWFDRLRFKYRLVIMNEDNFEEKLSFRLSRLNLFIVTGTITIILIILTTYLIAFTPLREYIPGYMDIGLQDRVYELQEKVDSLEKDFRYKDQYIQNIKNIIEGRDVGTEISDDRSRDTTTRYSDITLVRSPEDSLLRAEFEGDVKYDLYYENVSESAGNSAPGKTYLFFAPIKGVVSSEFNPAEGHFGIDIVANKNEAVVAALDGTVLFADWTVEGGYILGVQHSGNYVTVYKHNAVLLKKTGAYVKAGEPIAIVGESGLLTTGPHLHFELWFNGSPVNPKEYLAF